LTFFLTLFFAGMVSAAERPDAGQSLREIEDRSLDVPAPVSPGVDVQGFDMPAQAATSSEFEFDVKKIILHGITVFSEKSIQDLIKGAAGKRMSFLELRAYANRITRFYRNQGYFVAKAYIPAQEVSDGVIQFYVMEGVYDGIRLKNNSSLPDSRVYKTLESLEEEHVIRKDILIRDMLLLNDNPGINAKASLQPGSTLGSADLMVDLEDRPKYESSAEIDNYGNYYTGQVRASGVVRINHPTDVGDGLILQGLTSGSGLLYGRASYKSMDIHEGLRFGAEVSTMRYALGKEFKSLDANGSADVLGVSARYPAVRSYNLNLYLKAAYVGKRLQDRIDALNQVTDKSVRQVRLTFSGDSRDSYLGGGINDFMLTYTRGDLDIGSSQARLFDATTAMTNGGYNKLTVRALRLQRINDDEGLYLSVATQLASQNLDSSEKFILGGPYGVRAYPEGEAAGDEGYLLNVEYRKRMPAIKGVPGDTQFVGFFDAGYSRLVKHPWTSYTGQRARRLQGMGVGFKWTQSEKYSVQASVAWKVGSETAQSAPDSRMRLWVQGRMNF